MKWKEIRALVNLAVPIMLLQIGLVLFGVVDTLFMGKLGADAIAAVGLGNAYTFCLFLFGMGCLYGVDTLSSRAIGARKIQESVDVFGNALLLSQVIALPLFLFITFFSEDILVMIGVDSKVIPLSLEYIYAVRWFFFANLGFVACRQYLQSISIVRLLILVLVFANLVNALVNYVFVFGYWGMPALGVRGCGLATVLSGFLLFGWSFLIVFFRIRRLRKPCMPRWNRSVVRKLVQLGLPAGLQCLLEGGVFSVASLLVGRFGTVQLAAHQLALNLASVAFMIPLGISYAAAVRIGYSVGQNNEARARVAGSAAMVMTVGFMLCTCLLFILVPEALLHLYTQDGAVIEIGVRLLLVAGIFQIVDGVQIVLTGMIRGLGNTKLSMFTNFASHWCIGFPVGIAFAFYGGLEARGLWIGLSIGLAGVAIFLSFCWRRYLNRWRDSGSLSI